MDITQVATLVNSVNQEIIGSSAILEEDLSNVVDVGKAIFDATSYDKYVNALVDHIGRVIFVDRKYSGSLASLYRDNWEYGAVMEKIYVTDLPVAIENDTWKLTNGTSYDPNVFTQPAVAAKFYNKKTTFEVDLTLIANTFNDDIPDLDVAKTGIKAVNLLKLYNDQFTSAPLTVDECMYNAEFIRYAALTIAKYSERLKKVSTLFNCGGLVRFTPSDKQHIILLSDFVAAAGSYLQSDTYHNEFTALPKAITVPYWQGSGTDYGFDSISKVHIDIVDPSDDTKTIEVELPGVLGVIFDHDAAGITNDKRRVTSNYNAKAEFTNMFYKQDANYFVDLNENAVVFFVGEAGA